MGGAPSMLYSGTVEAAAGALVGGAISSVTSTYEMHEVQDVTLYSLKQELMKIQCAINAARRRRITDRQLLQWLALLIDAFYCGNYYYRTFNTQNSALPMIASEGMQFHRLVKRQRTIKSFIFGDADLKELSDTLRMLKSIDICAFVLMVNALPERPLKTHLYLDHNRLLYRDKERDHVMNFLFLPSSTGENNVNILPIVGPFGVGKTSLALHCFHDPQVQNYFSLKVYNIYSDIVYPVEQWDAHFSQKILEQCNMTITNTDESTLVAMLKQKLSSERFLLLMDCIKKVDFDVWHTLWDCLRCGKKGSKVIMIFDSCHKYNKYKKLIIPGAVKPIMLDRFCEEGYMLFFKEHAFGSADPEDYPELEKIGREIATEMNGSIWGAKIFGELLRDNLNAQFWSNFLREGLLKRTFPMEYDLFGVLRLFLRSCPDAYR